MEKGIRPLSPRPLPLHRQALLNPILRAYVLGFLSVTVPPSLSLVIAAATGRLKFQEAFQRATSTIYKNLSVEKFPAICAILIASVRLLPDVLSSLGPLSKIRPVLIRLLSSFVAALICFRLMNAKQSELARSASQPKRRRRASSVTFSTSKSDTALDPNAAGRTLDFTLFAFTRAIDVLASYALLQNRAQANRRSAWTAKIADWSEYLGPPVIFALSSSVIMWNWFYHPEKLPRSYNSWISSAAQIDGRLIEALRECRKGNFVYGKDTGFAPLCGSMCSELGMPREWGDPAKTIGIPCPLYHSGAGPSCEVHALWRFQRAWRFAFRMYLPLNILMLFRRKPTRRTIIQALVEASRSSVFLASFVTLFYYGVCLARTRLRNTIFFRSFDANQMDGGVCTALGSALCGWSIFIEHSGRRPEFAFFVAPRALATFLPRRYDRRKLWLEHAAFATSVAIVLTAARSSPRLVRGVFGRLLARVLE